MDLRYSTSGALPSSVVPVDMDDADSRAHEAGRMEAVAQALAVMGQVEGSFRVDADGDSQHPSFQMADLLREVALMIRKEVGDPTSRSALEIAARANEASELSQYVIEVSQVYASGREDIAEALTSVAGDIGKGTDGVGRLRMASDIDTNPEILAELVADPDDDVRWWAAQNPSTPSEALSEVLASERHVMVLVALLQNPRLPDEDVEPFASHSSPDVGRAAAKRLGVDPVNGR